MRPFISVTALVASSGELKQTKPNPLDRPELKFTTLSLQQLLTIRYKKKFKMNMWCTALSLILLATYFFGNVSGHGRLIEPPSRSSMWRFGFKTEPNYNDNELFCGGFTTQFQRNGGKCGICGDAYDRPQPRDNEAGGKYGKGIIVRHYKEGQTIQVSVELTANHQGYFEFKLCPNNNPNKIAVQECFDQYPLQVATGGGSKYYVPSTRPGFFDVQLQLPRGLTCTQCVLQWRYTSGNNWGQCPDGTSKVGCGPQETFMGCSDVAVGFGNVDVIPERPNKPITGWLMPSDWKDETSQTTTTPKPKYHNATYVHYKPDVFVPATKLSPPEPHLHIETTTTTTPSPVTTKRPKKDRKKGGNKKGKGRNKNRPAKKPEVVVTENPVVTSVGGCQSAGAYKSVPGMTDWCNTNCAAGFCPATHCACS